ncbi:MULTISPECIES: cupin domain-containing protein [Vibrio]|uniref:Cupin n=1 Tax=Vibrio jasicida TaxID=766224 RepID=A0AAU9QW71_9VIBR|nr:MULTISPECIES: cupin domain-containing protein [Vibrio]MCX2790562.1 cupin domain-containing protein [Vibrio sp. Sgm 5]PQJ70487.1 cupin [Vibrio jasicida]CAH1599303.1 Cupin [Vibrio jasicida]CAH1602075.1 Cupin [Vibrio jasicida]
MLNMDFSQRLVINTAQQDWIASPALGVWRKPLEREAKESGHTTSVVRYEPNSQFSTHPHPYGEEILVLEGVFSDEHGDYPAGTYLRNPPGSQHAPFSKDGCVILVKLNQFDPNDLETVRINTNQTEWLPGIGGLEVMPLHNFEHEHVALVKWPKGEKFQPHRHFGGEEIFVLSGEFNDELGHYPQHTWLRNPHMSEHFPFVDQETIIWVKTGHLPVE